VGHADPAPGLEHGHERRRDDISAMLAFNGDRIGVMWSNQLTTKTYFAVHLDSAPPASWQPEEVVSPNANCSSLCADDLFSLRTAPGASSRPSRPRRRRSAA
jgi:hypothetical protein